MSAERSPYTAATRGGGLSPRAGASPPRRGARQVDLAPYGARAALSEACSTASSTKTIARRARVRDRRDRLAEWERARRVCSCPCAGGQKEGCARQPCAGLSCGKERRLPCRCPSWREQAGSESVVAALRIAEKTAGSRPYFLRGLARRRRVASDLIWPRVERIGAKKTVVSLWETPPLRGTSASRRRQTSGRAPRHGHGIHSVLSIRPVALGLYERLGINPVARTGRARRPSRPEPSPRRPKSCD